MTEEHNSLRASGAPALASTNTDDGAMSRSAGRNSYRDTHKTVGAIRAAAFNLCQQYRALGPAATELHDSLCKALPTEPDTPVTMPRAAVDLLCALEALLGEVWFLKRYVPPEATTLLQTTAAVEALARAAIAKAEGREHPADTYESRKHEGEAEVTNTLEGRQ